MAAQAAVVLTDAAGTPVNRSFGPMGLELGVSRWRYITSSVAGYNWLTQTVRPPVQPQSDMYRISYSLAVPLMEAAATSGTSSGYVAPDKVAYTMRFNGEFLIPVRSVLQDRKDVRAMALDLLGESIVTNAVENLEPAW
jgi:hypothetical protein